jgi:lysophospholipase L1-like esterase
MLERGGAALPRIDSPPTQQLPLAPRAAGAALLAGFSAALLLSCVGSTEARRGGSRPVAAEGDPVPLTPDAALFVGRFQGNDDGLRFAWSGSAVTLRFAGTGLHMDLRDAGQNRFYALVDGEVRGGKIVAGRGLHTVELASGLPEGEHTVTLYRLTEPLVGETQLVGVRLAPGGQLLPPPAPRARRIEIIGDSISTGYGNEGADPNCTYAPSTQNHYETYGAVAARALEADLVTIAWSGKGIVSNRGRADDPVLMPELWRRTLPERADSEWHFPAPAPHAVVINLGTNDFAPEVEDTSGFAAAYARFLDEVRRRYPEAYVLCAVGPLLSDEWPPGKRPLSTVRGALEDVVRARAEAGDRNLGVLEFPAPSHEEGYGCDYHPSRATHLRMASALATRLREALGWQ